MDADNSPVRRAAPAQGGTVEPANRAPVAIAHFQTPDQAAGERYEMRDVCSGEAPVDVAIASGCFMLVRTAALRAVGGFNEDFFLYFEDFDLSLRLAEKGRLVFEPRMHIVHHGGYAANKGRAHVKYFIRSGIRFFNRHGWRLI